MQRGPWTTLGIKRSVSTTPAAVHRPHNLHPALIEERIDAQHHEIQSLLLDNQRLAATHVALKQELNAAQQELRHMSAAAANVKADRDAQVREVYERSLKLEAEVRSIDALNTELAQVRSDVQKLSASKLELTSKLQAINGDLKRVQEDLHQAPAIKAEIETMHHELKRGRAAIEYEKKTRNDNLEQRKVMEKNMIALAREVEKLRSELDNADKRARAVAAAAAANTGSVYPGGYGNPEMGYGGNPYVDPYRMHPAQGGVDAGSQYGSGAVSHGPYDIQQTQCSGLIHA
ncbi:hypothetical protein BVC80_9093g148 [Macleaya cordata]|uniref:Protein FLC EXPRESSOR n=1 Tax=Macleaya cordata TaxID=56857 RepID=A0A200PX56_MACCD|nr:hypothetical protein BVC80_9093g148 [Macleaya cordata]